MSSKYEQQVDMFLAALRLLLLGETKEQQLFHLKRIVQIIENHMPVYYRHMPYQDYLQTERWQKIKQDALAHAENRCALCGTQDNLAVCHRSADRCGHENAEDIRDVIVICQSCKANFKVVRAGEQ